MANNMHELTLRWVEFGEIRTQTIWDRQPSKNSGMVRIGRDPTRCDIVLLHPTVSGLHVEIFYYRKRNYFYLRNLRHSNPPKVDGKRLYEGEVILNEGSIIYLGKVKLKVIAIDPIVSSNLLLSEALIDRERNNGSPMPKQRVTKQKIAGIEKRLVRRSSYGDAIHYGLAEPKRLMCKSERRLLQTYGLECPQCHKISPLKLMEFGCPWCGASLAEAKRIEIIQNQSFEEKL